MKAETFTLVARSIGAIVFIGFMILIWLNITWAAILLFVSGITLIYLLKGLVKEPLIDERIMQIHMLASTRASQVFAILLLTGIIILSAFEKRELSAGLEIALITFLILKFAFTKYYEWKL